MLYQAQRGIHHPGIHDLDLRADAQLLGAAAQLLQERHAVMEDEVPLYVHGTGVHGGHFGDQIQGEDALVVGDAEAARRGHVDDDIALFPDERHALPEFFVLHAGVALVVPHVQVHDRGAGLPALIGFGGDLRRGHRQAGALGRRRGGAGGGHRQDDPVA